MTNRFEYKVGINNPQAGQPRLIFKGDTLRACVNKAVVELAAHYPDATPASLENITAALMGGPDAELFHWAKKYNAWHELTAHARELHKANKEAA